MICRALMVTPHGKGVMCRAPFFEHTAKKICAVCYEKPHGVAFPANLFRALEISRRGGNKIWPLFAVRFLWYHGKDISRELFGSAAKLQILVN